MIHRYAKWKVDAQLKKLLGTLPGSKKLSVGIGSQFPADIITTLQNNQYQNYDTILLTNIDIWRYGSNQDLLNFFSDHPAQQFYIQHLGYTHSKPLPNVCELSFNVFYFLRTLTQQNLKASSAKGFGSLNRGQRFHRTWLGYQLWYQNVLDHVIFSLGSTTEDTSYLLQRLQAQPRWQEFQQLLPIYPKG